MPPSLPAQMLRVVIKLTVIGFAGLVAGFALTPASWRPPEPSQTYLAEVLAAQAASADADIEDTPTVTPAPTGPRTVGALELHIGPGVNYVIFGSLPRGAPIEIKGRDATAQWLAVTAGGLNGWVPAQGVLGVQDVKSLPLAPVTFLPR